jgi:phosphoribosylanthranilate isomerase
VAENVRDLSCQRPLVKICGLTRPEDVRLATSLGAWALGFVFAPSPRRLTAARAAVLVQTARRLAAAAPAGEAPLCIGVFGNESPAAVAETAETIGLDAVQLHGERSEAAPVRALLSTSRPRTLVIRAVPVPAGGVSRSRLRGAIARASEGADLLLLDTKFETSWGGSGRPFAWGLAGEAMDGDLHPPYLVAGGITPDNADRALRESGAWGIDVSSGVERSPGVKDEARVRALFRAVAACRAVYRADLCGEGRSAADHGGREEGLRFEHS